MFFLDHAWLVPLIPALSFVVILLFGKRIPAPRLRGRDRRGRRVVRALVRRGRPVDQPGPERRRLARRRSALGALGRSIGRLGRRGRRSAGAARHPPRHLVRERGRQAHRRHPDRRPRRDDDVRRHADLAARARVLARVHARRPPVHALLRGAVASSPRRCCCSSSPSNTLQLLVGWELVGALLVHADRPLVGGEAELRRRAEGVPHHPYRRHRAADRRDHDVLRRAARHRARHRSTSSWSTRRRRAPKVEPHAAVVDRARAAARHHRQVGPVPAAHVAPRRHGRPHARVRAHPRRHHGGRRRVPRRARSTRCSGTASRSARPATAASTRWR